MDYSSKAVIFDMDGVLVDSEPHHFRVEKAILDRYGIAMTDKETHSFVGLAMDKMWERIREKYNLPQSVEELVEYDTFFRVAYFKNLGKLEPVRGIENLVSQVISNSFKTAVASSSHPGLIKAVLEISGLDKYFSLYFSGFNVPEGKPAPDLFIKTAQALGTSPADCLVIEDSRNGLNAAISAGMKCIGYINSSSGSQDLSAADMVIEDFSTLTIDMIMQCLQDNS